jgi:hypothetical protein
MTLEIASISEGTNPSRNSKRKPNGSDKYAKQSGEMMPRRINLQVSTKKQARPTRPWDLLYYAEEENFTPLPIWRCDGRWTKKTQEYTAVGRNTDDEWEMLARLNKSYIIHRRWDNEQLTQF